MLGAGAILAMTADLRLGRPRTKTAFLFTRVGLAGCDMGACAILPRIVQEVCMQVEVFSCTDRAFAAKQKPQFEGN